MIEEQELRKQKLQRLEEERIKYNQFKEEHRQEVESKKKQEQKYTMWGCLVIIIIVVVVVFLLLLANYSDINKGKKQLIGNEQPIENKTTNKDYTKEDQSIQAKTSTQTQPQTINTEDISSRDGSLHNSVSSIPGRFPKASERLLTTSDLQGFSKYDLKIMRNEIFARHGYIFQTIEMKNYFQNQSWYTPEYRDVSSLLSNIEKKNVALIKRYE